MSLINDALKRAKQAQQSDAPPPVRHTLKPVDTLQRQTPWPKYLIPALIVILLIGADLLIYSWWQGRSRDAASTSVVAATPASQAPKTPSPPMTLPQTAPTPVPVQPPVIKPRAAPIPVKPVTTTKPTPVSTAKASSENPAPRNNQTRTESQSQTLAVVQPKVTQLNPVVGPASTQPASPVAIKPVVQPLPSASAVKPPPTPTQAVEFPPLQLQGIFYLPSRPSAVVNGRTVVVGDQLGEAKVQAIDQRSVKIELKGQVKVLWLQ